MIKFALAVSRTPIIGSVLRGQVTGSPKHTDGDIINFGPIVRCERKSDDWYVCTDLNSVEINVKVKQAPRRRIEPPKQKPERNIRHIYRRR